MRVYVGLPWPFHVEGAIAVYKHSRDCVMTETRLQFDMRVRVLFENMETPIYGGTMAMLRLVD
jgi:hypothetical protein